MAYLLTLLFACSLFLSNPCLAQTSADWQLDKMPADLETAFALSALPPHLRAQATVYLLDPAKGFYVAHRGSNGFICFISRTEWEWGKFRKDLYAPMAYDAEGARTIFPVYRDMAAMRASGRFTALQIKDTVISRIRKGIYKPFGRAGLSYMLAPVMRVYTGKPGDENVMTMSMPHYMFYAPYIVDSDIGTLADAPAGPWLLNGGNTVLGEKKGPYGFIIVPADAALTAKLKAEGKGLVKRLAGYSPYFRGVMEH